jgi:superfamily II DNA or RNA helicase
LGAINANCQAVAVAHELIQPGERFAPTDDQRAAIVEITTALDAGKTSFCCKAPTGSGKTEVMLRVAVETISPATTTS